MAIAVTQSKTAAVSKARGREMLRVKREELAPIISVANEAMGHRGLAKRATADIERSISAGGQPRSTSTTASETSGPKRGRWDPNGRGRWKSNVLPNATVATEQVVAEDAPNVPKASADAERAIPAGRRERVSSTVESRPTASAGAEKAIPAGRGIGTQPSKRRPLSASRPSRRNRGNRSIGYFEPTTEETTRTS